MNTYLDELRQRMALLSDDSLLKVVTTDIDDYEPEAVGIAKDELMSRNICVDELVSRKQLNLKADIRKNPAAKVQVENHSDEFGYDQNKLYKAAESKLLRIFRGIFKNYKALALIMAMEFILQFSDIKRYTLLSVIYDLNNKLLVHTDILTTVSAFLQIALQLFMYLGLVICTMSGILHMYKKDINHDTSDMSSFIHGIRVNWKGVLIAGFCLTTTVGILKEVLQGLIIWPNPSEGFVITYLKSSVTLAITYLYLSLLAFGSLILIETGINIKQLFLGLCRFIFSGNAVKLLLVLLFAGLLYQPINILRNYYLLNSDLFAAGSLFSFIDVVSKPRIPLWVDTLELLANTIITSFVLFHTSLIFHSSFKSNTVKAIAVRKR